MPRCLIIWNEGVLVFKNTFKTTHIYIYAHVQVINNKKGNCNSSGKRL